MKLKTKQTAGIIIAGIVLILSCFIPGGGALSQTAVRTLGLVVAFLIMLITEALSLTVTCLIFLALMPVLSITPSFSAALSGFSNQVVFFIIASFGIAAGFTNIPLSKRILILLLRRFGKNVKSMLLSMMVCAALLSSVVSNVPTCAIFMAIGLSFLELYEDEAARKRSGMAFMIGIPVASMIGGMMTPAGSSINLLAISLLEQFSGLTITFVQWMAVGIPLTIFILPVAWLLMVKVYKPAEIDPSTVNQFISGLKVPEKLEKKELRVLLITLVMLVLWILSSWIRGINVMVVAVLGCCALFLPGIEVLEWKSFSRSISWDSFFLVGTVLSIGAAMVANGVSEWIITLLPQMQMSLPLLIAFTAGLIFVMLIVIPVAPSLVTLMASPLIALASFSGVSPAVIILALGLCAANCYLLPLDTVTLLTYGTGCYTMTDMPKSTLPLQLWIILIMSIWMPFICRILGLA